MVIAIAAALAIYFVAGRAGSSSAPTATGSFLAPAPDYGGHPITDNIPCEQTERITYHVHAHLAIFVNGQPSGVPYGIGIAPPRQTQDTPDGPFVVGGSCFYWLHTHDATGVIHVEGPNPQNFTLGQFFDVWQQPLSASQVGPQQGTVIAYLNGQKFSGDPRTIPLAAHNLIQLDLGQDTPPASYTFAPGL
ncbi:MAG: hypothetical protein JOZ39_03835 [Chloroflexi bacterium]|nr:hypothetical protein [Chloroflexota bacterium]